MIDVDAYLKRIGASREDSLPELHRKHLLAVPFENLSIHLGEPIVLDPDLLFDKIVNRRRGGFCYELNGLFAQLLTALGHTVEYLAAAVYDSEKLGPPFDHLALRVDRTWLADVGFGKHSVHPLRLDATGPQDDPGGVFAVEPASQGDVDVTRDGGRQYKLELRARALADFAPTCWWQQTSADSDFTRRLTVTRLTHDGRVTFSDRRLIRTGPAGKTESVVDDDTLFLSTLREEFGIDLDRVPAVG
ncbi:arylamine N-acetyltransferase family protein [Longispora albida]|uniref:arylamine N-acetyltransferase family protein n=1 Tax=Longispora albida TaxID=203523 RepID=UPI0003736BBE|nr:arylamine N-acetyltransferase [Longispora albida]